MGNLKNEILEVIKGEAEDSAEFKSFYSHDASMFELVPEVVVAPADVEDVKAMVRLANHHYKQGEPISLTARSGGTDMSGAAISESVVMDFSKHFTKIGQVTASEAQVQPGVFYRDFEPITLEQGAIMPSFPASRDLCTVGGMVANNSGGEKSLRYGKVENFVNSLKVVLADGNEYEVKPLNRKELNAKIAQNDYEGEIYRKVFELVENHYDEIKAAKPKVSKDSTGYHLWNIWDRETGVFDLNQAIIGSQGTLGLVTDINFRLVPAYKHSGTLVMFLRNTDDLGKLINDVMAHQPATFEGFDNYTLMLSFKLFFLFHKRLGWWGMIKLAVQLIPDALKLFRGIPKMVMLIEFDGNDAAEVARKVHELREALHGYDHESLFEEDETEAKAKKFWIMRRESFKLLRDKVKDKHTAPFMDDLIVRPEFLPEFLPRIRQIIKKYNLLATIAGHMGDGNFHIIPLMNIERPEEKAKLEPAMREINKVVLDYQGSLSGEHNDGMIRGPWLREMYGAKVMAHFKTLKEIFDPNYIFNPHKKSDADWQYSMKHLREKF